MTSGIVITFRIGQSAGKRSKSVKTSLLVQLMLVWLGYDLPSETFNTDKIEYLKYHARFRNIKTTTKNGFR